MEPTEEEYTEARKAQYAAVNRTRRKLGLEPIPFTVDPEPFYCAFCGKEPEQVEMMAGGPGVYICDMCIQTCYEMLEEREK